MSDATSVHGTPLPTIEPASNRKKLQERVISMEAYHKESSATMSTRSLTRERTPENDDSSNEKEKDCRSFVTSTRSISRGRSRTKSPISDISPHSDRPRAARRFSGESHWDGLITAETTIQVDELVLGDFQNRPEDRNKFMITPPPSMRFESEQARRQHGQVVIEGGSPAPPSFAGNRRSKNKNDSPPTSSHTSRFGGW
jgi:hypothetical protein